MPEDNDTGTFAGPRIMCISCEMEIADPFKELSNEAYSVIVSVMNGNLSMSQLAAVESALESVGRKWGIQ